MTTTKCAVIGLDGATFDLILPMVEAGELPTLGRLLNEGSWGPLRSTILPNSFPGWASATTGTSEGMHGIFSPFLKRREEYGVRAISAVDLQTRPIWDLLNAQGYSTGIINIPTTYPVETVTGYQVTGMLTPSTKSPFTYPPSLQAELLEHLPNYIIEPRRALGRAEKAAEFRNCLEGHVQAAEYLIQTRPTDFLMIVLSVPDRAQHDFWADMDPAHFRYDPVQSPEYSEFIREIYRQADAGVERILRQLPDDVTVVICSDHGFSAELRELRVNEWLAQRGFLRYQPEAFRTASTTLDKISNKLTYHYRALSTKLKPHSVLEKKVVFGRDFLNQIDWEHTTAFFGQDKGVWINLKGRDRAGTVEPQDFERVRSEVIQALNEWMDPETGKCVFEAVVPREATLTGRFADRLPDILVIPKRSEDVPIETASPGAPIVPATTTTGTHAPDGILLMAGPHIRKNHQLTGANLRDITPTALFALGAALTQDMDGQPLLDAFTSEFTRANPIRRQGTSYKDGLTGGSNPSASSSSTEVFSDEEASELEERLRALGYLG